MANKTKGKQATKSKRASDKKVVASRRAPKKKASKKQIAKNKIAKKRGKASSKKTAGTTGRTSRKPVRKTSQRESAALGQVRESRAGAQSGDLQGLHDTERANSESVDELLQEGNAFEAGIVMGVEEAEDNQESEVHTHEVLEDDVPEEYQDKD